jgi:hypothetical protein
MRDQPNLFGAVLAEYFDVRWDSPPTSQAAAASIAPVRTALHLAVLEALRAGGPMTDEQLEQLPQFSLCGPSTIRKRRSELAQQGAVRHSGDSVNSRGRTMRVWAIQEER